MKTGPRNISIAIRELLRDGTRPVDISKQLQCAISTITYHAKRLGQNVEVRPTYDWSAINAYHNQGHSISECVEKFGFCKGAWHKAKTRGVVTPRNHHTPLTVLLTPGREQSRGNVKARLLKEGLLQRKCYSCGITEWKGKPLAFNLDHKDGNKLNWALENLQMICPNCDSQQDTFAGKNAKRLREQKKFQLPSHLIGRMQSSEDCHVGPSPA